MENLSQQVWNGISILKKNIRFESVYFASGVGWCAVYIIWSFDLSFQFSLTATILTLRPLQIDAVTSGVQTVDITVTPRENPTNTMFLVTFSLH